MRLPFQKKGGARRGSAVPQSAVARPARKGYHWDNQWTHPQADPGLPGICGYLNGIQEGDHPSRFVYVRPDGNPDDYAMSSDSDSTMSPSRRPVPRGFFGP